MRGVKIKCGLFLALFIMLGLSLSVSFDTNALKHNITAYPIATLIGPSGGWDFYQPFQNYYASSSSVVEFKNNYYFLSDYDDGVCSYSSWSNADTEISSRARRFVFPYYDPSLISYDGDILSSLSRCNKLGPFDSGSNLAFNESSLPAYVFGTPDLASLLPYWYGYASALGTDSYTNDGLNYTTKLDLCYLYKDNECPNGAYEMTIPLGIPSSDNIGSITEGRSLSIEGEFMFDSDNPDTDVFSLGDSFSMVLYVRGYESGTSHSQNVTCSTEYYENTNELEAPWIFDYSCSFESEYSYDDNLVGFTLDLNSSSSSTLFNSYPATFWLIESSFLITDDIYVSGSDFTDDSIRSGGDLASAPGSAQSSISTSVDYNTSLTNLFDFSFLNPFAGIFSLFQDNSSCVSIPILASMLNSTETTYCPWFDSIVRDILTPVLGMASVMLLFGFTVRWLGASSGNMFEDSGHIESPGYSATGGTAIHHGWRRK